MTQENLTAFHSTHFSHAPLPSNFFVSAPEVVDIEEEDDGLGYYEDGMKRTLTDEQITMFRHSEIQQLLRQRRLQRERDADDDDNIDDMSQSATSAQVHQPTNQKRSQSASKGSIKRNWEQFVEQSDTNPDKFTHRRLARELDEQKAASVDLLYGDDDDSTAPKTTNTSHLAAPRNGPSPQKSSAPAQSQSQSTKQAFHWPVLGDATRMTDG